MLDDVASGSVPLTQFLKEQEDNLHAMLDRLDKVASTQPKGDADAEHQCPECKSALQRKKGKKGFFWGCSAWPNCTTTLQDIGGKPVQRKPEIVSAIDCPTCQSHKLAQRQGKKGVFWGCKGYPECKAIFWDSNGKPDLLNVPKKRQGAK